MRGSVFPGKSGLAWGVALSEYGLTFPGGSGLAGSGIPAGCGLTVYEGFNLAGGGILAVCGWKGLGKTGLAERGVQVVPLGESDPAVGGVPVVRGPLFFGTSGPAGSGV